MKNNTIEHVKTNNAKHKRTERVSKAQAWENHAKAGKPLRARIMARDNNKLGV
jgi:predicted HAD superfamily phosphohydrolase YqeG